MGNNEDVLKILKFLLIIWQKNDLKKDLLPLVRHEVVGPKMDLRYPGFATIIDQSRRPAVSRRLNVASAYYVKLRGDFMICQ